MPKTRVRSGLALQQAELLQIEVSIGDHFTSLPRAIKLFVARIAMDQPR